jgi:prephenate dehydrogenase
MNNVLIVGLGLIGGSIAKALKASKNDLNVYGFDKSEAVLKAAIGDETINSYINIDDDFDSIKDNKIDLIIICTPLSITVEILDLLESKSIFNTNVTITEVSSSKLLIEEKFGKLKNVVLSHPMTGSDQAGYQASIENLFHNKKTILINSDYAEEEHVNKVGNFWKLLGSSVSSMSVAEHESAMAFASHLPHLISFALVNSIMIEDDINISSFAAGGLKEFLRIAGSDPKMWADIFASNKHEIRRSIKTFKNSLDVLEQKFSNEDDLEHAIMQIKKYKDSSF